MIVCDYTFLGWISNWDTTYKHLLSLNETFSGFLAEVMEAVSECFLDEYALKSGKAVCHHLSKTQSNQRLQNFIFILVLSVLSIYQTSTFPKTSDTLLISNYGDYAKSMSFLYPPVIKQNKIHQPKEK